MKKYIYSLIIITILTFNQILLGQNGDPPEPGGSPVGNENPVGGGAPIGGGILFLVVSAIGYGVIKYNRKNK